jgi:hypothetical protein
VSASTVDIGNLAGIKAISLQPVKFQVEPKFCLGQVASVGRGMRGSLIVLADTGSHLSDTT